MDLIAVAGFVFAIVYLALCCLVGRLLKRLEKDYPEPEDAGRRVHWDPVTGRIHEFANGREEESGAEPERQEGF